MATRFKLFAVVFALFGATCARQTPTEPTRAGSAFQNQDPTARVGDVSGGGDISLLISDTDLPGGGFLIEGGSGDALSGGFLPADVTASSVLFGTSQNVVASESTGGCYIRQSASVQGSHACLIDRSTGRFEGAQSLAGYTSSSLGLLDFFLDSSPLTILQVYIPVQILPPPSPPSMFPSWLRVHAVFRLPHGKQDFLIDKVVDVDPSYFVPLQPFPQMCRDPLAPTNQNIGVLGFVRFDGILPHFGQSTGVASICVLTPMPIAGVQ